MKLYEIDAEIEAVEEALNLYAQEHSGDITDFPFEAQYKYLKGARTDKLLNLGSWYKSVSAESEAFANEIKVLQQKKRVRDNKMQWIKNFINFYLNDGEKINDTRVQLSWRKSESIEVNEDKFDIRNLEPEFKVITQSLDKTKIKSALKIGKEFKGITLKKNNNLQIK